MSRCTRTRCPAQAHHVPCQRVWIRSKPAPGPVPRATRAATTGFWLAICRMDSNHAAVADSVNEAKLSKDATLGRTAAIQDAPSKGPPSHHRWPWVDRHQPSGQNHRCAPVTGRGPAPEAVATIAPITKAERNWPGMPRPDLDRFARSTHLWADQANRQRPVTWINATADARCIDDDLAQALEIGAAAVTLTDAFAGSLQRPCPGRDAGASGPSPRRTNGCAPANVSKRIEDIGDSMPSA